MNHKVISIQYSECFKEEAIRFCQQYAEPKNQTVVVSLETDILSSAIITISEIIVHLNSVKAHGIVELTAL